MPKRDGRYIILTQKLPTSYVFANPDNPNEPVGTYHTSELKVYKQDESATPVQALRKRGRPRKTYTSGTSPRRSGRRRNQRRSLRQSHFVSPSCRWMTLQGLFRDQKQDRQSHLTVRARTMAFFLSRGQTNLAMLSELYNAWTSMPEGNVGPLPLVLRERKKYSVVMCFSFKKMI
ncbi:hypothetical protein AVEN_234530-1 [Araneus ventricosus]|uniref:Uncharacterized protein n=1 Tax=Araneus ventricosus TaxID=182803 RepID=A0A4Y2AAJ0_ARAVE|nr:hypothetical protein AVEN_234530-1 [Araneus ventricosus]